MRAMSSRLLDQGAHAARLVLNRLRGFQLLPADSGGLVSARDSASPTSTVSGVRKSCDSAASSELRRRSDSIRTSASCATPT